MLGAEPRAGAHQAAASRGSARKAGKTVAYDTLAHPVRPPIETKERSYEGYAFGSMLHFTLLAAICSGVGCSFAQTMRAELVMHLDRGVVQGNIVLENFGNGWLLEDRLPRALRLARAAIKSDYLVAQG